MKKLLLTLLMSGIMLTNSLLPAMAAPYEETAVGEEIFYVEELSQNASLPAKIELKTTSYTYDGKTKKPSVIVKDAKGKTVSSKNYKVTYSSGCKNVGEYKVTVKFNKVYSGTKTLTFKINPPKTTIKKIDSITQSSAKVTITPQKGQVGSYELQCDGGGSSKTVTISGSKTNASLTGLKSGTKYSLKVRTCKKVSGKSYYSPWSTAKNFTTKNGSAKDEPQKDPQKDPQKEPQKSKGTIEKLVLYEGSNPVADMNDTSVSVTVSPSDSTDKIVQAICEAFGKKYTLKGVLSKADGGGLVTLSNVTWKSSLWTNYGKIIVGKIACTAPDVSSMGYTYASGMQKSVSALYDAAINYGTGQVTLTDSQIKSAILAFRSKPGYTEGAPWTNDDQYKTSVILDGAKKSVIFAGCTSFAMTIQDSVFGNLTPIYTHKDPSRVKVGDYVVINGGDHTVLVYEVDGTKVTVCEGNYNKSVHWGRTLDLSSPTTRLYQIWTRRP